MNCSQCNRKIKDNDVRSADQQICYFCLRYKEFSRKMKWHRFYGIYLIIRGFFLVLAVFNNIMSTIREHQEIESSYFYYRYKDSLSGYFALRVIFIILLIVECYLCFDVSDALRNLKKRAIKRNTGLLIVSTLTNFLIAGLSNFTIEKGFAFLFALLVATVFGVACILPMSIYYHKRRSLFDRSLAGAKTVSSNIEVGFEKGNSESAVSPLQCDIAGFVECPLCHNRQRIGLQMCSCCNARLMIKPVPPATEEQPLKTAEEEPTFGASEIAPKTRFCRKCGFELLDSSKSCSHCGTEIIEVKQS